MNPLRRFLCRIGYHKRLIVIQRFTPYSRRIGCPDCHRTMGMNDDARTVLPWTVDLAGMYETLGYKINPPRWP